MPCYDNRSSPEYKREEEIREVEERYGVRATKEGLARAVACELAVVLDDEDAQLLGEDAIVDPEGEAPHRVASQIAFDHGPETGRRLDLGDRRIERVQEAVAEPRRPRLVELGRLFPRLVARVQLGEREHRLGGLRVQVHHPLE